MSLILSGKMMGAAVVGWNSIVGSVVCLRIWRPEWFAYPTITIYASTIDDTTGSPHDIKQTETRCDLKGLVGGELCQIYKTYDDISKTQKYIHYQNDFEKDVTTIIEKDRYYKIEVSKKLLLELQQNQDKKIVVSTQAAATIKLTALFAVEGSQIHFFKEPNNKFWIGSSEGETKEITSKNNDFSCKVGKDNDQACEIYDIQSTETTDLESITAIQYSTTKTLTKTNTVKKGNYYLIKINNYDDYSIIGIIVSSQGKSALMEELHKAVVIDVSTTQTLFQIT